MKRNRSAQSAPPALAQAGQYFVFRVAEEFCGVEVLKVADILPRSGVELFPLRPKSLHQGLRWRDHLVPVVDLRQKFRMEPAEPGLQNTLVIVHLALSSGTCLPVALLADQAVRIAAVSDADLQDSGALSTSLEASLVSGLVAAEGRTLVLLNVERLILDEPLALERKIAAFN